MLEIIYFCFMKCLIVGCLIDYILLDVSGNLLVWFLFLLCKLVFVVFEKVFVNWMFGFVMICV